MPHQVALICDVTGQDGAYLAKLLFSKGYVAYGSARDATNVRMRALEMRGIRSQAMLRSVALSDLKRAGLPG